MRLRITESAAIQIPGALYLAARQALIEGTVSDALRLRVGYALLVVGMEPWARVGAVLWAGTRDLQVLAEQGLDVIGQPLNALAAAAARAVLEEPEAVAPVKVVEPEEDYAPPVVTMGGAAPGEG